MNTTGNNNDDDNRLLSVDEIDDLVRAMITAAIDPTHHSIILTENYNGIDVSQLSAASLTKVRNRFVRIVVDICDNVDKDLPLIDLYWGIRNLFDVPDVNLEDTIVAFLRNFYKIYFSLAYKVTCTTTEKPKGHPSPPVVAKLYAINPNFVEFEDGFLTHQLRSLEEFLSGKFATIQYHDEAHPDMVSEKFKELVKVMKKLANASVDYDVPIDNEMDSVEAFKHCILNPVQSLLKLAGCRFDIRKSMITAASINRDGVKAPVDTLISDLKPDIVVDGSNRTSIMFCEMKGPSFQTYKNLFLDYGNLSLKSDKNFKKLLLQNANYLINTGTDISLMSDFHSLVILGLDYSISKKRHEKQDKQQQDKQQQDKQQQVKQVTKQKVRKQKVRKQKVRKQKVRKQKVRKQKVTKQKVTKQKVTKQKVTKQKVTKQQPSIKAEVTFKCQFIDNNSAGLTIQSVFACILYYQLYRDQYEQHTNSSILCRKLSRSGFHMSIVYRSKLREFKTLIYSEHPTDNAMKNIKINLDSLKDLEVVLVADDSNAQVVRFKNNKYNSNFINGSSNSDKSILIKMYDNMSLIKLNALTHSETLCSDEDFKRWIVGEWSDEVRRYQTIAKYRKKNPKTIDVPEFFSHGILQITDGDTYICGGLFIAMEYIEPMEYPQDSPDIDSLVLERCKHSVKQLIKLKVKLNYISRDELIYHDKKLFLIDFSNESEYGWWDRRSNFEDIQNALEEIKGESAVKVKSNDKGENRHREGEVNGEKNNSPGESVHHGNNTRKRTYNEDSSNKSSKRRRV